VVTVSTIEMVGFFAVYRPRIRVSRKPAARPRPSAAGVHAKRQFCDMEGTTAVDTRWRKCWIGSNL